MRNRRKRLGFGLDGGEGGGGGGDVGASVFDGALGAIGLLSRFGLGGIEVGGAVWTFPPGG